MYSDYQNVHVVFNRLIRMKPLLAIFRCNYLPPPPPPHTEPVCQHCAAAAGTLWHWCQMAEFRAAGPKNGPVKFIAA
jgi:hypothetical protein